MANYNSDYRPGNNGSDPYNGNNYYGSNNYNGNNYNGNDYGGNNYQSYDSMNSYYTQDNAELETQIISKSFVLMVAALLISMIAAYVTINDESLIKTVFESGSFSVLCIVEFAVVIGASWAIRKNNAAIAGTLFVVYSIINGMTLSCIFFIYEITSIEQVFISAAVVFGIMAAIGMTTKKDLNAIGTFGMMALIGMITTTLLNMLFFHSTGLDLLMDYVGVLVFAGLTAYDTQKMRQMARSGRYGSANSIAVFFAMQLYLDFINLFLRLLSIMGKRK